MTRTVFNPGDVLTSIHMNAVNNPQFTSEDVDGGIPLIVRANLDPSPGELLDEWDQFSKAFLVTEDVGTTVDYRAGTYHDKSGDPVAIPAGSITLPADGDFYIYIDGTGAVGFDTSPISIGYPIAKVTTAASATTAIVDLRPLHSYQAQGAVLQPLGGSGDQGSLTVSGALNMTGDWFLTDWTATVGSSITIDGYAHIRVSGPVLLEGQIAVLPGTPGGGGFLGSVAAPGVIPSTRGLGQGGGGGFDGSSPITYSPRPGHYGGSGGGGGLVRGSLQNPGASYPADSGFSNVVTIPSGGDGGGVLIIEASGPINVNGAVIQANGGSAQNAPQPTTSLQQYLIVSGSGGGSGGLIWLISPQSITISNSSSFSVSGGSGGSGNITANRINDFIAEGGGGGGGGYIILQSPTTSYGSATFSINGGSAGASVGGSVNQFDTVEGACGGSFAGTGGISSVNGSTGSFSTPSHIPH